MKTKTKIILIAGAFILLILLFGLTYLSGKRTQKQKDIEIARLTTENQMFATIHTGDNEIMARQEQRIMDLQTAEKALLIDSKALKADGIKKASVIVDLKTEVARLKLEAQYTTKPEVIHDTITLNGVSTVNDYLKVPLGWKFEDKWNRIYGIIKTSGNTIDSLFTYSQPKLILGYSTGFLKKSKPIVVYKDLNPNVKVLDMSNIVIPQKPPFLQRPTVCVIEGILTTVAVVWLVNQVK